MSRAWMLICGIVLLVLPAALLLADIFPDRSAGGGVRLGGTLTTNSIPRASAANALVDSNATDDGATFTVANTNDTSISICNSAACDTVTIATNADADTIQIGDSLDTLTLAGAITTSGALTQNASTATIGVDQTVTLTGGANGLKYISGDVAFNADAIAVTATRRLLVTNTTAGTVGVPQQQSPDVVFEGHGYSAGDIKSEWIMRNKPDSSGLGELQFVHQQNGGAEDLQFLLNKSGIAVFKYSARVDGNYDVVGTITLRGTIDNTTAATCNGITSGVVCVNDAQGFTVGQGTSTLNGAVKLGSVVTDITTLTGKIAGATPIVFDGATADAVYTQFAITDPTTTTKTITFPNANITVNAAADISGTTLAAGVVTSSLTAVGALAAGSISAAFGAIDVGTDAISTTGLVSAGTLNAGSGTTITKILSATASLDFVGVTDACESLTVTLTGAAVGNTCEVGTPATLPSTNSWVVCFVSAANTVTVRHCAHGASGDPAAATYRVATIAF